MATIQAFELNNHFISLAHHNTQSNLQLEPVADYLVEEVDTVFYLMPETLFKRGSKINCNEIFHLSIQNVMNADAYWDGNQLILIPNIGYRGPVSFECHIMDIHGVIDSVAVSLTV